jgi:hypothetical protein
LKLKAILLLCAVLAVAAVVFFISNRPKAATVTDGQPYVWDFNMDALRNIEIILPKQPDTDALPNHQAWVQHDDRYYYFVSDETQKVDMQRWGGGIPLILSGPGATRIIAENISDSALEEYGFTNPTVIINLKLNDEAEYHILVGDNTPGGNDYYIKLKEENIVYTVDKSWYEVLSGLVTKPPYEPAHIAAQSFICIPAAPVANQPFIVRVTVTNTGVYSGSADITLKINGDTVEVRNVTVDGGTSPTYDFNIEGKPSGNYTISFGGTVHAILVIP